MEETIKELIKLIETSVQLPRRNRANKNQVLVWIDFNHLSDFVELVGYDYFAEGDFDVTMMSDCICFDAAELLENMEIEENEINYEND